MYAWSPHPDPTGHDHDLAASMSAHRLGNVDDPDAVWPLIMEEVDRWLMPDAVRAFYLDPEGRPAVGLERHAHPIPSEAAEMEANLLDWALRTGRSGISNHPNIDHAYADLSRLMEDRGWVVHVLLLRAHQRTHGVVAVHWFVRRRPSFERRAYFYRVWDSAGLAVERRETQLANQRELARLERAAYFDLMTGLPNRAGLDRELDRHVATYPLGVLVADFDGLKEANTAFGHNYELGGDVLIRAVAGELGRFAQDGEFPARLHTRGDEFCLLLPGADEVETERRAVELEDVLQHLQVPETHRHVYKGASVGHACRLPGEPPNAALGRASESMNDRKEQRRGSG